MKKVKDRREDVRGACRDRGNGDGMRGGETKGRKTMKQTKAQARLARAIAARRREIEKERAALQKEIDAARPQIERLAANGTAEERRVARHWLALDDRARRATA